MKITREEILLEGVKALTYKQPFASLMLDGKQETRSRRTTYRGLVLIVAGKKDFSNPELMELCGEAQYYRVVDAIFKRYGSWEKMPRGQAIAIGRLTGCKYMADYKHSEKTRAEIEEKCFVKFNEEKYIWEFQDVAAIDPLPWVGTQTWQPLNYSQLQKIKLL